MGRVSTPAVLRVSLIQCPRVAGSALRKGLLEVIKTGFGAMIVAYVALILLAQFCSSNTKNPEDLAEDFINNKQENMKPNLEHHGNGITLLHGLVSSVFTALQCLITGT